MFRKLLFTLFAAGSLAAAQAQTSVVFPRNSTWKYLDNGSNQGTTWQASSFVDTSWASGAAELGYGDGDEITVVGFGPSATNRYPTTYFRTSFTLTALPTANQQILLRLKRDDGAVVYINGTEAYRVNMPSGTPLYSTYASVSVAGTDESTFFESILSSSALQLGVNTIAVEVHQDRANSSDLSFDLELAYKTLLAPVACDGTLDSLHISRFVSVLPSAQPDSLRIPSTHTFQMLVQEGDAYTNAANGVTKGLFDFTGYTGIGGRSDSGYISLNHELGSFPAAGVSVLSVHFDTATHAWNLTKNVPVDFGPVQGTGRNCSGGITPWGTTITSEEILPTADANSDGYQDIGWHVEIDPATASVKSYNGTQQKLWKMGRMSHENICVDSDMRTAYYGNDENPGFIFKFVADNPQDLSDGNLYVLKLDGALDSVTSGKWIGIPNNTPADCNNTKAYAASVGATNFFNVEDVEIGPHDGKIYFTSKTSSRVYRFEDHGTTVGVSDFEVFVGNTAQVYNIQTQNGLVPEQWRDGVDNLCFDNEGNLYVIQDGGRNHVYMVPPCHTQTNPAVKLFMVTPAGCEPTGMTFSPDNRFMFISMQHPSSTNTTVQTDASGAQVKFNKESCIVIARKEMMGPAAIRSQTPTAVAQVPTQVSNLDVYPNPTTGLLNIQLDLDRSAPVFVHVYDLKGSMVRVLSKSMSMGTNILTVDMANLPEGIYNAIVTVNGRQHGAKIIKK
ncbi:MAG: DUF839 domain-containing protein [Sphingobacteriales bacterium]|nr:MAG: DUF839 domain-containing protein [Sphingobacteriales bacterium]